MSDLNSVLLEIIKLKARLATISYDSEEYDVLEEELYDLSDDFMDEYGELLEDSIADVYDDLFPDAEVLSPLAYIAKKYESKGGVYSVSYSECLSVDPLDPEHKNKKLVLLPSPCRLVLFTSKEENKVVWTYEGDA